MGVCCRENASEKGKYGDCFGNFLNSSDSPPPGINLGDFPLYDEDSCNSDTTCEWLADVESCNPEDDVLEDDQDEDIVQTRNNSNLLLEDLDTNVTKSNTNKILKYTMLVFIVLLILGTMYIATRLCILYICNCKEKGKNKSNYTVLNRAPLSGNTWSPASKNNLKSLYGPIIDQLSSIKITPPSF